MREKMRFNSFKISPNYWLTEFQCRHCGVVKIANRLVELLEEATRRSGVKFLISSGYRCEEYNKEVGGVPNSYHVQGLAVDILLPPDFKSLDDFAKFLESVGFRGIGIYRKQNFVHVDLGPRRRWEEK